MFNIMQRIEIKAISINKCFQGRRFRTKDYKIYQSQLFNLLPNIKPFNGNIHLIVTFGLSSKLNDIDNGLKPFIDVLQSRYEFNDRDIYKLTVEKVITKKGKEFIEFEIKEL